MAEKKLAYKSNHVVICDVAEECQNLSKEYFRVNPKGLVTTLVHNGEPVYDAHRIIRYVDEKYPESGENLWPSDPRLQAIAEIWFEEGMLNEDGRYGSNFGMGIPILSHPILARSLNKQPLDGVIEKYKHHPIESRGKRFTALRRDGKAFPAEVFTEALTNVCQGLVDMNCLLDRFGGPWLLGDFSLPDITMMACFHRLEDVSLDVLLRHDTVPLLSAYWDRLQARPTYQVAVVDWHDDENFRSAIREVYGDQRSPLHDQGMSIMTSLACA
jgi:glutathione S-transferase